MVIQWPAEREIAEAMAFGRLRGAIAYLAEQFNVDMSVRQAQANIDARAILIRLATKCMGESQ